MRNTENLTNVIFYDTIYTIKIMTKPCPICGGVMEFTGECWLCSSCGWVEPFLPIKDKEEKKKGKEEIERPN